MYQFRIFSIGINHFQVIVAKDMHEALNEHIQRVDYDDEEMQNILIYEVALSTRFAFQNSDGTYEEMTFAQRLKDFHYRHPVVICWQD